MSQQAVREKAHIVHKKVLNALSELILLINAHNVEILICVNNICQAVKFIANTVNQHANLINVVFKELDTESDSL